jgi:hypothetical protein
MICEVLIQRQVQPLRAPLPQPAASAAASAGAGTTAASPTATVAQAAAFAGVIPQTSTAAPTAAQTEQRQQPPPSPQVTSSTPRSGSNTVRACQCATLLVGLTLGSHEIDASWLTPPSMRPGSFDPKKPLRSSPIVLPGLNMCLCEHNLWLIPAALGNLFEINLSASVRTIATNYAVFDIPKTNYAYAHMLGFRNDP